jgi:hypothetical protein
MCDSSGKRSLLSAVRINYTRFCEINRFLFVVCADKTVACFLITSAAACGLMYGIWQSAGVQIPVHYRMLGIPLLYLYRYNETNLIKR